MMKKLSAYWWCQIIGWCVFLLLVSFFYFFVPRLSNFPNYFSIVVTTLIGFFSSHLMRGIIIRANLLNLSITKQFVSIAIISILFSIVFLILQWLPEPLYLLLSKDHAYNFDFWESVAFGIFLNAQFFGLWNLIYFTYHNILKKRKEKITRIRLENELKIQQLENENANIKFQRDLAEASLIALRSQMNPHFIFNSLNSINRFILLKHSAEATAYLTKFSRLIRMILNSSANATISLAEDLEALQLYLELESLRFEKKFCYTINCHPDVDANFIQVPSLLLQPFVENAIWHGLMNKEGEGHLVIHIHLETSLLVCTITDDGIGRKKAAELENKSAATYKPMGMRITAHRIALLQEASRHHPAVTIHDLVEPDGKPAGTEVIIQMPVMYA